MDWENICTNCGKCCLIKLQFDGEEEVCYTNLVCKHFDHNTCKCTIYETRTTIVPECLKLTPDNVAQISWMPKTCAYRILHETGKLPDWHPLITGNPLEDKHSIKGKCINQEQVAEEDWEDYIIENDQEI